MLNHLLWYIIGYWLNAGDLSLPLYTGEGLGTTQLKIDTPGESLDRVD